MKKILVIVVLIFAGFLGGIKLAKAQVPNNPYQVGVSTATHTSYTLVAGSTQYCFAFDGLWQSINGAAYVQVTPGVAGVTSWNGLTGVVVYTAPAAPVTSVNGKTGAVTIAATATAPTVTLQ